MMISRKPRRILVVIGASLLETAKSFAPSSTISSNTLPAAFLQRAKTEHAIDARLYATVTARRGVTPVFVGVCRSSDAKQRSFEVATHIRAVSNQESWETDGVDNEDDDEALANYVEVENGETEDGIGDSISAEPEVDPLLAEYQRWSRAVEKSISALQKKRASLEKELEKAERMQELQDRANRLKTNWHMFPAGVASATVKDWDTGEDVVLTLDPEYDSVSDEVDALFAQAKKFKRGKQAVNKLLEQTCEALDGLLEMKGDLDSVASPPDTPSITVDGDLLPFIQDRLLRSTYFAPPQPDDDTAEGSNTNNKKDHGRAASKKQRKPELGTPASNVRKLKSSAGCTILVGRNRRGNEYLSLGVARGDDIWMHARGSPGAHVLVLQRRGSDPVATEDCLQLAANLAAFFSDARAERNVEVTAAEPKHVQKPRGAPLGAVKLREELRVFFGHPDAVPEDLKEARAVSGLSDEYRIKDKSKLRKQNKQQVAKQKQVTQGKAEAKKQQKKQEEADRFY